MITELKNEIYIMSEKSIFSPDVNSISDEDWSNIIEVFQHDFYRYYNVEFDVAKIKYFPV
jgi:hypothetical protein